MESASPTYSVVIPVYNSQESVVEIKDRLKTIFEEVVMEPWELILIDDGSIFSETWPTLEQLALHHPNITSIQLTRNFGKAGALIAGFRYARGKFIITMDDDLQHLPEDIPLLLQQQHHDIVLGHFPQKEHNIIKRTLSSIYSWAEAKLINKPTGVKNSPFRLINKHVIDSMLKINTPYPSIQALLYFVSQDAIMVNVTHAKRAHNRSGFTLKKMWQTFSNLLFNNSAALLKLIAVTGSLISILSIILGTYFIFKRLFIGVHVQGWTSLITVNLFLGGIILFAIGILGEYQIRIINGTEKRPSHIIRRIIK
ncbi:glycosyltransferase family 2 protein [Cytophagaceae bacterium ABcell3]|nr:glycosyltransferase family 2 protein [Cytophagaceae bacterium ABcell3]